MSPQHLQLVINRLDYTLNIETLLRLKFPFIFLKRKVNSVRSKVLNDYGHGGEKSTYTKHICSGHSSPEMQKTQDIYYSLLSTQSCLDSTVRAMSGTRSRTRSPPATSRSAPWSPRRPRHGSSFPICKLKVTYNTTYLHTSTTICRGRCCVHNGTLYEVGTHIEHNSDGCEEVVNTL